MKFLFFFVHPSKFHVFRNTINQLIDNGHEVKVLITSKDVLEELVKTENWDYHNIFPEGRKIKNVNSYLSAIYNTIRTVYRLKNFTKKKYYDLFITDDLLVINGFFSNTPSILLQDDDVTAVPESTLLHIFTKHILTQKYSNMGLFNFKKIPMYSFKELGYLHPNKFKPDFSKVKKFHKNSRDYFILRLVSLTSTHDNGNKGLEDEDLSLLISNLKKYGNVYITSERKLPSKFEKYRIKIPVNEIAHALYYAKILIADSQTMSAEAAVLGTPFLRFNDFVGKLSYLKDLEENYKLGYGFKSHEKTKLFKKLDELLKTHNIKSIWNKKKRIMIKEKIDLTDYMLWLFQNYPNSIEIINSNPDYQLKFK